METHVALIRSVTVSGRTLATADLERVVSGLDFADVRTYGESGNMLFDAEGGEPLAHAAAIETAVERDLGPRVGVLVMTAGELARVAASDPFLDEPGIDEQALYVTLLFPPDEDFGPVSEAAAAAAYETASTSSRCRRQRANAPCSSGRRRSRSRSSTSTCRGATSAPN